MRTALRIASAVCANAILLTHQLLASAPPPVTFEPPNYTPLQPIHGAGWHPMIGDAIISPQGAGYLGGQALQLNANPHEEAWLRHTIDWEPLETVAFIDFRIKPAADPAGSLASFFANGSQVAFQVPQGQNHGEVWVYHGGDGGNHGSNPPQWFRTAGSFALNQEGTAAAEFLRVTLRHDYQNDHWDLYLEGNLVATNLAFDGRLPNLQSLEFFGSRNANTLIDDLCVSPVNMLFEDADKDGIPDAWEALNGANPNLHDRDALMPGTDGSFLDAYLDSVWSDGSINAHLPLLSSEGIPPLSVIGSHQPVTSLKGSLSIGADGAANYTIPIDLPKGTAGLEPNLSLTYSSNGGNGLLGLGWSITGLQSITRGPASHAKDGFNGTVRFDGDDRFFFNGERLICVAGIYGQQNSEYRTEIDSFARITLKGGDQDSPSSWWQVETKAGLIIQLGNSADSKVFAPAVNAPLVWDASQVSDTVGNFYTLHWADTRTPDNLELANRRISHIAYTGSTLHAPYCRIDFGYQTRPDTSFAYTPHGARMDNTLRLYTITISTNNQTNHTYHLQYVTSAQTSRSLLKSVYKQMADGSVTQPTVFSWDGLQPDEPRWAKLDAGTLPRYHDTLFDANTANINSAITTNGTSVRLDGDVARFHVVPGNMNVTTGTFIEFDFRGALLDNGAYLVLDGNTQFNNIGEFCIRIKRTGAAAALPPRRDLTYTAADGAWQTFRVGFQGDPNAALNLASGSFPNLALLNYDDNAANGVGYAEFKNIRVGSAAALDAGSVPAITFPQTFDIPQFTAITGASRGMRIMDLNSDGLSDLVDQKVQNWTWQGDELVPVASAVSGTVYRNTGSGFVIDASLEPNPRHTLTNVGGGGDWITRYDLNAVPCDVNADGQTDLLVTELRKWGSPGTNATQRYKFMTYSNGSWVELTSYTPSFESRGTYPWGSGYPGWKQLVSKELVDVNRDGYPDLVIETNGFATLASTVPGASPVTLVPALTRSVFLNLVHLQQGWVQADHLALPLALQRTDNVNLYDRGNRLMDLDGDGFLDMLSATVEFPVAAAFTETRFAYRFNPSALQTAQSPWTSPTSGGLPADRPAWWLPAAPCPPAGIYGYGLSSPFAGTNPVPLDGNAPLMSSPELSTAKPSGTTLLDVNGDGLVDINRSFSRKFIYGTARYERSHSTWFNTGRETTTASSRWLRDGSAYGAGYTLPISLTTQDLGDDQSCHQFADLNGDGLVDILYAREGTKMAGPAADRPATATDPFGGTNNGAFINTGSGWAQDTTWALPTGIRLGKISSPQEAAILADMNGDGFPDIIGKILDGQKPELWLNQARPEVLISVTDGFGSELAVEYHRLNDPSPTPGFGTRVYQKHTGPLPVGHAALIDSTLVVSRYSEPDGTGGRKYKSQRYGDLRYDRLNQASLGFGWIEALDESSRQITRTETSRTWPFAGSPVMSITQVDLTAADIAEMPLSSTAGVPLTPGLKTLTLESSQYDEQPPQQGIGGTIRRPVQTSATKHLFDLDGTLKVETITL